MLTQPETKAFVMPNPKYTGTYKDNFFTMYEDGKEYFKQYVKYENFVVSGYALHYLENRRIVTIDLISTKVKMSSVLPFLPKKKCLKVIGKYRGSVFAVAADYYFASLLLLRQEGFHRTYPLDDRALFFNFSKKIFFRTQVLEKEDGDAWLVTDKCSKASDSNVFNFEAFLYSISKENHDKALASDIAPSILIKHDHHGCIVDTFDDTTQSYKFFKAIFAIISNNSSIAGLTILALENNPLINFCNYNIPEIPSTSHTIPYYPEFRNNERLSVRYRKILYRHKHDIIDPNNKLIIALPGFMEGLEIKSEKDHRQCEFYPFPDLSIRCKGPEEVIADRQYIETEYAEKEPWSKEFRIYSTTLPGADERAGDQIEEWQAQGGTLLKEAQSFDHFKAMLEAQKISTETSTDRSTNRITDRSTNRITDRSTNRSTSKNSHNQNHVPFTTNTNKTDKSSYNEIALNTSISALISFSAFFFFFFYKCCKHRNDNKYDKRNHKNYNKRHKKNLDTTNLGSFEAAAGLVENDASKDISINQQHVQKAQNISSNKPHPVSSIVGTAEAKPLMHAQLSKTAQQTVDNSRKPNKWQFFKSHSQSCSNTTETELQSIPPSHKTESSQGKKSSVLNTAKAKSAKPSSGKLHQLDLGQAV